MCYYINRIISLSAAVLVAASVTAQTVTVSKLPGADFTTVQAAIDSYGADLNPAPNIIQITDSSIYEEVVTINLPATIIGTNPVRPTLALIANAAGKAGSAGCVVKLPATFTTGTVALQNLILLPSRSATPQSCALNVVNNNVFLHLNKVLISGNDGTDLPISATGLASVTAVPAHVNFGDDGIVAGETSNGEFEGAGVEILLRDTVITHLKGAVDASLSDGIKLNSTSPAQYRLIHMQDGNVLSYNGARGADVFGDLIINSPTSKNLVVGNASFGLWLHDSPTVRSIRGLIATANQVGIYESSNLGVHMTLEDSIVAANTRQCIRSSGSLPGPFTFLRCTIGNQGGGASYEPIRIDGTTSTLTFTDCIITGNGNASTSNTLTNLGEGTFSFVNSALVMGGAQCLTMPILRPGYIALPPVVKTDPLFVNVSSFTSPDYYDVASSSYAALGSLGQPLKGGADYVGAPAPGPAMPQVVTVSKTGPANFTTIQGAIDSLTLDPTKTYTVQILDASIYDEVITLNVPATLVGTGANRPILAVQANPAGFDNEGTSAANAWSGNPGLTINIPDTVLTSTVRLKNLVIIPSKVSSPPATNGIANTHNNFFLDMENVLVSGNNGLDQPISTDGVVQQTTDPAHVHFVAGGANLGSITNGRTEKDGLEVQLKNCIFTHMRVPTTNVDGDIAFRSGFRISKPYAVTTIAPGAGATLRPNAYRLLRILDGCIFSYNIFGFQSAVATEIEAPTKRVLVYGNRYMGINLESRKGSWMNGLIVANNTNSGIAEQTNGVGPRMYLSNAVIANNGWYNLYYWQGAAAQPPAYLTNVTLANQSNPPTALPAPPSLQPNLYTLTMTGTSDGLNVSQFLYVKDSIIAGNGTTNTLNVVNAGAQLGGTFLMDHAALPLTGNRSLIPGTTGLGIRLIGTCKIVGTPISSDPMFTNMTDPTLLNFYSVTNPAYATLSSGGTPLRGGSVFVPSSSVSGWMLY